MSKRNKKVAGLSPPKKKAADAKKVDDAKKVYEKKADDKKSEGAPMGDAMSSAGPTTSELMQFMKTMNESLTGTLKEVTNRLEGLEVIRG
eukprot:15818480-Heterocapsa_arctica.AAC.1